MSHFIDVCECGITMRQCRCPGPKTEHVITPCKHAKPDITELLRENLRQSLLQAGHSADKAEEILVELEALVESQVAKLKAHGREQT